jgi:hypothetical protein
MVRIDARIPVFFTATADTAAANIAWLVESPGEAAWDSREAGHVPGCACCVARSPVAEAMGRLFRARAVGDVPFFTRLGVVPAGPGGEASVRQALETDGLVSAFYRLETTA